MGGCYVVHVKIRGHLSEAGSLPLLRGSQEWSSDRKTFPRLTILDTLLSSLGKCLLSVREKRLRLDQIVHTPQLMPSHMSCTRVYI